MPGSPYEALGAPIPLGLFPSYPKYISTPVRLILTTIADVNAFFGTYTYANGVGGVGATMTENVNGLIPTIDSVAPAVGDRVFIASFLDDIAAGIYVVTSVGSSGSKWILTRSSDCNTAAVLGSNYFVISSPAGARFGNGLAQSTPEPLVFGSFTVGTSLISTLASKLPLETGGGIGGSVAVGFSSSAATQGFALGLFAQAFGNGSVAVGTGAVATNTSSTAVGGVTANGQGATGIGSGGTAYANWSVAIAANSTAWAEGQATLGSSAPLGPPVPPQYSVVCLGVQTTDATVTDLVNQNGDAGIAMVSTPLGAADYTKSMIVTGRIVGRRTDVPGTDSSWTFQGLLRGTPAPLYAWVAVVPNPAVLFQDAAAAAWAVTLSIVANVLHVQVKGAVGATVNWECTLTLDEVSG